jgi:hypothetical protein
MNFYFSYAGNKRQELKTIENYYSLDNIETIVEPFGGSVSFSRELYLKNKNLNFDFSDIDNDLIYFCNNFYKKSDEYVNKALEQIKKLNTKVKYLVYLNKKLEYGDDFIIQYLIRRTFYSVRCGLYPTNRNPPKYINLKKNMVLIDDFFKNNNYLCSDFKFLMDKYKDDEKALIFIDPPYLVSCNDFYKSAEIDWEYIFNFFENCKCKFIMVVNHNIFMNILFKKWFKHEYSKKYEMTHKEVKHVIFSNF